MSRFTERLSTGVAANPGFRRIAAIVGAAATILGALAGVAKAIKAGADSTYVHQTVYEAHVSDEKLLHAQDHTILLGIDSARRCSAGQQGFCR